jgi:hypothetical protein
MKTEDLFYNPFLPSKRANDKWDEFDSMLTGSKDLFDSYIYHGSQIPLQWEGRMERKASNINLEVIARGKIDKNLRPYTKSGNGELRELTNSCLDEEIIAAFVLIKLRNPSPTVLWYNPRMVKLAEVPIKSRITEIATYEKTKADLYQAIEDLEKNHEQFLKDSAAKIESVLERGHNFIL